MGPNESWLALDVGGANLKAAHSAGAAGSWPFELWRRPEELAPAIARLADALPAAGRVALTMTAELCDCYPTKRAGVLSVVEAVTAALPELPIWVWGLDGRFHTVDAIRNNSPVAAAANWLALATVAARLVSPAAGLLVDVGSTTTDLIPLNRGVPVARGRTDTERLQSGELVYAGVRRTPVCALATSLTHRGRPTGLAAELFATTLDVFLTLGEIPEDPHDRATADGRPATVDAARDRLARMVGADREGFSDEDAAGFAGSAREAILARLVEAAKTACLRLPGPPAVAVVSGSGEFLARRLAERVLREGGRTVSLTEIWGRAASGAGCARALLELVGSIPSATEGVTRP